MSDFGSPPGSVSRDVSGVAADGLVSAALVAAVRAQYQLHWRGVHGVVHWARVLENGLALAPETGARADVVTLFALFHDACRHNDRHDPEHGPRAAVFARRLHANGLFTLDAEGLDLLAAACHGHTNERTHPDATVRTCYDADRLDLARCGITPDPRYLCTDAARAPERIAWAIERSITGHEPEAAARWTTGRE
ncbi:MAG TPA: hypothetical protein VF594_03235 [Rubricoccaceae bacterium]|jgi:uncharacterized protein